MVTQKITSRVDPFFLTITLSQGQFAEINPKSDFFYLTGDVFCVAPSAILCSSLQLYALIDMIS